MQNKYNYLVTDRTYCSAASKYIAHQPINILFPIEHARACRSEVLIKLKATVFVVLTNIFEKKNNVINQNDTIGFFFWFGWQFKNSRFILFDYHKNH